MATKSQSPGANPTTSQAKQPRSRKGVNQNEQVLSGRAGSAGGIMLVKEGSKSVNAQAGAAAKKAPAPTAVKDKDADGTVGATSTGSNRQRRRPRKLNKEPPPTEDVRDTPAPVSTSASVPPASAGEIEALKSRVRGLEAKVEELYKTTEARMGRSPRRRGKGRKASSGTQVPTLSSSVVDTPPLPAAEDEDEDEEADEELKRLEGELEVARRDLDAFRPRSNRPRAKRTTSEETVEEIPREGIGATGDAVSTDRQVTLTGSYRIPLPASVSMTDVKTIQSGVSAAQNVAKSFLEQRRANQAAAHAGQNSKPAAPKQRKPTVPSMEVSKETEGKSWSEWFGGYSMAISRAVRNIEAEAALESQGRSSGQAGRAANAPSKPKKGAAAAGGGATAKGGGQRPAMKARQANLSSEQSDGLVG